MSFTLVKDVHDANLYLCNNMSFTDRLSHTGLDLCRLILPISIAKNETNVCARIVVCKLRPEMSQGERCVCET
jgi:hypothetical protein